MSGRITLWVEWFLAALVLLAGAMVVRSLFQNGLLPHPFFYNTDDTFMDWYNVVYWSHNKGAYDAFESVYPPLAFVITRILSISSCYVNSGTGMRGCDHVGVGFLLFSAVTGIVIIYRIFRLRDPSTAAPRAIALGLGLPMLSGLERGNILIPCFTLFVLGSGRLLRSARIRWLCYAAAINLKPYLVLPLIGQFAKGRWRWLEGVAVSVILIYAASFAFIGDGSPLDLVRNIVDFSQPPVGFSIHSIEYVTSYSSLLRLLKEAPYPIIAMIGSKPVELLVALIPPFTKGGVFLVLLCMVLGVFRPSVLTANRLGGLSMALLLNSNGPGAYATIFLLFYVFQERWRSWVLTIPIVFAYLLSIPWDFTIAKLFNQTVESYLTGRQVVRATSIDVGQLLRPGFLILIEYGLAFASLWDFVRLRRTVQIKEAPDALGSAGVVGAV